MGRIFLRLACMMAAILVLVPAVSAENATRDPNFTFKRVKPPTAKSRKRIMVQIVPGPAPKVAAPAKRGAAPPKASSYTWFWNKISPTLEKTGPWRLEHALAALTYAPQGQGVAAPRLQDLQGIVAEQGVDILKATIGTNVSPALALAVMLVESGGRVDAVSSAGAEGLMQLMPATAKRFGVSDASVASQNIKGGVAFLDFLMKKFDGDPILVLAGYNAGENSIPKHDGVPPYAETRDYVPKVLAAYTAARGFCKSPPQLFSDGCVFVTMK